MNLLAKQNYGDKKSITYNTFIGGVASVISTASALSVKLGISVGNISNFTIVGSDIKCKITGSYAIPATAFDLNSTLCTYYFDTDYLVSSIGNGAFYSTSAFSGYDVNFENCLTVGSSSFSRIPAKNFLLKNATTIGNSCFAQVINQGIADAHYIPNCTSLGTTSGNNTVFEYIKSGAVIYTNPSLATNNSGSPDGDLAYAITQGATVRYVTNFTAPNPVTNLTAGTIYNTAIQLNFTPPSTTNAIDYYELYINGAYNKRIISGDYATGLIENTSYNFTVYARDIFYNLSPVSNTLTQSTSNYSYTDADANAYISAASLTGAEKESSYLLITGLKTNSLYTQCQAIYPFKGTSSTQQKYNAKNPIDTDVAYRLVFTGSPIFSNNGYLAGGGHANTFLIPNSVQNVNSNGLTVVVGTNNTANTNDTAIGAFGSGSNASWIVVKGNNTTFLREARVNFAAVQQTGVNEAKGIWTATRQSSTVSKFFRNNTSIGSVTATGTLPTFPIWIGDLNNNGSVYGSTSQRIQIAIIHEGFSDAETTTLYSVIDLSETIAGRKTW